MAGGGSCKYLESLRSDDSVPRAFIAEFCDPTSN